MDKLLYKYQEYRADAELEASPSNEAARGVLDRMRDAARSAGIIGPETPSVMSPTGDLGKMPEEPKEPTAIRASTPQETQKAKAAPTAQEAYDPSQAGLVESSVQAAKSQGAQALGNTYAGAADFYGTLDNLAGIVSRKAGMGKPEVFDYLKRSSEYWAEHYYSKVSIDDYMTRVVGGVLGSGPALTEFAMGTGWAALKGFAQDENLADALYSAGRRAAAGSVFKAAHRLDPAARVGAGTSYMTGESIAEQIGRTGTVDIGQTAEAAGVGAGMMLSGGLAPGNKAGLRQRVNPETWFETSKQGNEIYRALDEGRIDALTKDLTKEFYTSDLMRGGTALNDTSMAVIDKVNLIKRGVDEWILESQGIKPDPEKSYAITGRTTTSAMEDGTYKTAIELYQGAKAETLVEEWLHREYDRLPSADRNAVTRAYEAYKSGIADGEPVMSEAEFYAKGATDKFFADRVAAQKAANRPAWVKAVDAGKARWDSFVQAVRGVPGAKEDGSAPAMQPGDRSEAFQSAFHGSPYRFDKFTLEHIGSGEGAQAYGWGLYFAGDKEVAEYYREALTERYDKVTVRGEILSDQSGDVANAVRIYNKDGGDFTKWKKATAARMRSAAENGPGKGRPERARELLAAADFIEGLKKDDLANKGQLYKVTIPDDHTMLDWDKPLSEQPEQVKKALEGVKLKTPKSADGFDMGGGSVIRDNRKGQVKPGSVAPWVLVTGDSKFDLTQKDVDRMLGQGLSEMTGQGIYGRLVSEYGSQQAASEYLKSIGIPGLRYLDGTSRGKGEGHHNYVIFDDAQIAIDKTYYQIKDHPAMAGVDMNDAAQVAEAEKLWAEMGTESPYFKKWFGDSKVVDAQGKPLVVYHGKKADISYIKNPAYDTDAASKARASARKIWAEYNAALEKEAELPEKERDVYVKELIKKREASLAAVQVAPEILRVNKGTDLRGGFFDESLSGNVGTHFGETTKAGNVFAEGEGGAVFPVYLNIKNPATITNIFVPTEPRTPVVERLIHQGVLVGDTSKLLATAEKYDAALGKLSDIRDIVDKKVYKQFWAEFKKTISPDIDGFKYPMLGSEGGGFAYVAFNPTQIKSVFNRGTFDASDPRISMQVRPVDEIIYDPTPAPPLDQKYAEGGNTNLQRINSTEDVLKLINDVSRHNRETGAFEQATRGVRTWEETNEAAQGETRVSDLLFRKEGQAGNAEQLLAARQLQAEFAAQTADLIARAKQTGEQADKDAAAKAWGVFSAVTAARDGMAAEAGRALNIMGRPVGDVRTQLISTAFADLARKHGGDRNADAIMDSILDMSRLNADGKLDIEEIARFARKVEKASTFDMILEARYMAMLANPATHIKNTLGNSIALGAQVPERLLAEGIGAARSLFSKDAIDRVEAGETLAMMYGGIEGLRAGATAFVRAVRTGESTDPMGKLETTKRAITAENMGVDPNSPWGKGIDFIAERLRTGNVLLGAEDDFFKAVGYSMELNARAHRTATREGLTGQEFAERVQELVTNPPWSMQMDAMDFAHYTTFTNALGEGLTHVQAALGADRTVTLPSGKTYDVPTGKMFRLAVPFFRTPANIVNFGLARSPFAVFMPSVQQDLVSGGAARDMAISRIALGSTLGFMAAQAASAGLITGGGPSDPKQKENLKAVGWQPYSVKVGEKWVSYQSLEPYSMLIGAAADVALFDDYLEENERNNAAMMVAGAFSQAVTSKTFMQGMAGMIDVLQNPDRYGDRYAQQFAASFVPSPAKAVRRDIDPVVREVWTVADALKNAMPGYSGDLYPRRNRYGEPITMGEVWLSNTLDPVRKSEVKTAENSPTYSIDKAILENNVSIPRPGKVLHWEGVKVELTPEEYDTYQTLPRDLGLVEALQNVVASESFASASGGADGIKSHMLREVFGDFREQARWELVKQSQGVPGGIAERIEIEKLAQQARREAAQ